MEVREDREVIRVRGDYEPPRTSANPLSAIIENPAALKSLLGISEEQSRNIRALIAGAGAAAGSKYLGEQLGEELSAAIGAFAAAWLGKKILR